METESRFAAFIARLNERLQEQVWYQQIKGKWDELDAKTKGMVQVGAAALGALIIVVGAISLLASARSLRKELTNKKALLAKLETANEEMRDLRALTSGANAAAGASAEWPAYFQSTAGNSGIAAQAVTVSEEKPGSGMDNSRESLFDISLKDVNARQLARFAFFLENGGRPVKLRNLSVDTREDLSGFLAATLSVSAFSPKEE